MSKQVRAMQKVRWSLFKFTKISGYVWTAAGSIVPLFAAIIAIPLLIKGMGVERFGVLSVAWIVVGYFSLFDFGLGRALTHLVASKIGEGKRDQIPALISSGMLMMISLGVVGAILVALITPWLVGGSLKIPESLQNETLISFFLLAASIPLVIITTALRGILEALQRFDVVNLVRVPLGALTYFGPLAVLSFSNHLPWIIGALIVARFISMLAYLFIGLRIYPELAVRTIPDMKIIRQFLHFGGWMTVSNVAAPVLLYAGRLGLAFFVSAEAVAYFSTPYDVVVNLLLVPGIFVTVLFPVFSQQLHINPCRVRILYHRSLWIIAGLMLPACILTWVFARVILTKWIGQEFAEHSYRVAQWLAIGVFINSFGHISQSLIQALGRPDLTAKLHVIELVLYLPYMWWLIRDYGIDGAAISWVIRVLISTIALLVMARYCLNGKIRKLDKAF